MLADPNDPVTRALTQMQAGGQLPPTAPVVASPNTPDLPPDAGWGAIMGHFTNNMRQMGDDWGAGGTALGALIDAFDLPQNLVYGALGTNQQEMQESTRQMSRIMPAPSFAGMVNPQMGLMDMLRRAPLDPANGGRRWSPTTTEIGFDILTDPTSYIGVGVGKGLAKAGAKSGSQVLEQLGRGAQIGDDVASAKMGEIATAVTSLIQNKLIVPNKKLGELFPDLPKWTEYARREAGVRDALGWLTSKGGWDLDAMRAQVSQWDAEAAQTVARQASAPGTPQQVPGWPSGANSAAAAQNPITWAQPAGVQGTVLSGVDRLLRELPTQLQSKITADDLNVLLWSPRNGRAKPGSAQWNAGRNPVSDPEQAMMNYQKWLRTDLDLNNPARFAQWYGKFNDWWKRQALGSLNYMLQNMGGGVLMQALEQGPEAAARTAAELIDNAPQILRGQQIDVAQGVGVSSAQDLAARTGLPLPGSLHEMADRALQSNAGSAGSGNTLRDSLAFAALGGVAAGPPGALVGGAFGAAVGRVGDRIRKSAQVTEQIMRERGWEEGVGKALAESMSEMEDIVIRALQSPYARVRQIEATDTPVGKANSKAANVPGSPIPAGTPQITTHTRAGLQGSGLKSIRTHTPQQTATTFTTTRKPAPVAQSFQDTARDIIKDSNGQINVDRLVQHFTAGKVNPHVTAQVARDLDDVMYAASQRGSAGSNAFNFDYQDLSNIERVISDAFPFSTWFLKAAPFFMEQGGKHPLLLNTKEAFDSANRDMRERDGLTARVRGVENQTGSALLSAIVGRPTQMYTDPISMFFPFAGVGGAMNRMEYLDEEEPNYRINQAMAAMEALGLGLGPVADTVLRTTGIVGDADDPVPGYIRAAPAIAGTMAVANRGVEMATGTNPNLVVDLNRGPQKIEEGIREMRTGREVTVLSDVNTSRRLDEIALRETGKPIGERDPALAPYVRAKRTQAGPLWDKAKAEVELERGIQGLGSFVYQGISPSAIVTSEEATIRKAKAGLLVEGSVSRDVDKAAEKAPQEAASPEAVQELTAAVAVIRTITGQPTPDIAQQWLANPTNANMALLNKEIYAFQAENQPLIRGYSGGGSPEERRIQNNIAGISQAGYDMPRDQYQQAARGAQQIAAANGRPIGPIAAAQSVRRLEQESIKVSDPLTAEYMAWKKLNPTKEVADFLAEKYNK